MTNNNKFTHDYFLPHVRTGLATRIPDTDDNGKRATVPISLDISAKDKSGRIIKTVKQNLAIYGPGDVTGFNKNVVLKTVPNQNTSNFRADLIPYIEFSEPDFLWRYSAAKANNNNNWIPWLSLIILKEKSEIEAGEFSFIPQLDQAVAPCIQLSHDAILPDLKEAWRWAHIHVNEEGGITNPKVLQNIIQQSPQKAAARLMAPRRLKTKTRYTAFVIPTYRLGVEAAKGETEFDSTSTRKTLAWNQPEDARGQIIPYYFKWSFQTGQRGDFEQLIRKLGKQTLEQVGQRPIDCSEVGFGLSASPTELKMESALQSLDMNPQPHGLDNGNFNASQKELSKLLNKGSKTNTKEELTLVPPIYGRWYQSKEGANFQLDTTPKSKSNWIAELNLDYRHRVAAGLGVQFVKENQETLMRSAWKQLAEAKKVNQQLNYARFGRAVSTRLYKRINSLDEEQLVRLGLPLQSKITDEVKATQGTDPSPSLQSQLNKSKIRKPLLNNKIKKFLVPKYDPTKKTTDKKGTTFYQARTKFNFNKTSTITPKNRSVGGKTPSSKDKLLLNKAGKLLSKKLNPKVSIEAKWKKRIIAFRTWEKNNRSPIAENNPSSTTTKDPLRPIMWYPKFHIPMYQYLRDRSPDLLLAGLNHVPQNTVALLKTNTRFMEAFMLGLNHEMAAELRWRKFPTDMRGSYFTKFWDTTSHSISEADRRLFHNSSIAKILLEKINVLGVNNLNEVVAFYDLPAQNISDKNREAIQLYEIALEKWLLVRPDQKDIHPIGTWSNNKRLGTHSLQTNIENGASNDKVNQVVLLIRSELLQKAPSTLIYLAPKIGSKENPLPNYSNKSFPIFEGDFSDVAFLGFKIKASELEQYFLVFEEPMTHTSFGLDEKSPAGETSNVSWQHFENLDAEGYLNGDFPKKIKKENWNNPAFIAKVCTQKSVRLAVPLQRFLNSL